MNYLFQGLILGFAYVMPIGTQNMFVINTALTQKRKRVLITAAIVAFFDISLAAACFFGVGALIDTSRILKMIMLGIGSLVVIWIGIGLIRSKSTLDDSVDTNIPVGKVISTACVVTWFNPQAIIDGSMLLGTYRSTLPGMDGAFFILGVCLASLTWWFGMSSIVNLIRDKITDKVLRVINIVCGAIIIFYGARLFFQFLKLFPAIKLF